MFLNYVALSFHGLLAIMIKGSEVRIKKIQQFSLLLFSLESSYIERKYFTIATLHIQ